MKANSIEFCISAGKLEQSNGTQEVNWKYVDNALNCIEAMEKYHACIGYDVVELHLEMMWSDGTKTRVSPFGGPLERLGADGKWHVVSN